MCHSVACWEMQCGCRVTLCVQTRGLTVGSGKTRPSLFTFPPLWSLVTRVTRQEVCYPPFSQFKCSPLAESISRHGLSFHCYADDTQLYLRTTPTLSAPLPTSTLTTCLEEREAWMKLNFIQLNSSKTEAILVGTYQICSSTITNIPFDICHQSGC